MSLRRGDARPVAGRLGPPASQRPLSLGGGRSLLLHRRALVVTCLLVAATVVLMVVTVLTGAYEISAGGALRTLGGQGSDLDRFIVLGQRLPRTLAAALVGVMLALSGAVFQSLSRNPLGSPDIVGFTTGASTGGLVVILLSATSTTFQIAAGTILGGSATAAVVALVASAAMGSLVLVGADLLAQRLLAPFQIPVGLLSAALGGLYLVWLLVVSSGRP